MAYKEENFPEYRNLKSEAIRKTCLDTGLDESVCCQALLLVLCRNKQEYFSDCFQYIENVTMLLFSLLHLTSRYLAFSVL